MQTQSLNASKRPKMGRILGVSTFKASLFALYSIEYVQPALAEHFIHEKIVASHFFINTLLQRGVLRGAETQNRFNGF